ncbi:MAG TPA: hypothetical protein VIA06_15350 [Candidatus Dormibacteraeota bacterium]|jgi:hypothetical protein|nr:hypothetical protein [Candidatus Dormibacteraeota bacterium]
MADSADRIEEFFADTVERDLEGALLPIEGITDPLSRYKQAARAEAFLLRAADWLTDVRAASTLRLHEGGASYAMIAEKIGLSRARAQQLVNRGREVETDTAGLVRRQAELLSTGRTLRERMRQRVEESRRIREAAEQSRRLRARNRRVR